MRVARHFKKMDILNKACIHIDSFKMNSDAYDCLKLSLCSHAHRDHVPTHMRNFKHPVHCSLLSSYLISECKCVVLEPDTWLEVNKILFYNFETEHCPGSLAYFFPRFSILFLGDTRITPRIMKIIYNLKPNTILFDNTHETLNNLQPSISTSAILLKQAIDLMKKSASTTKSKQKKIHLCLPHIGVLLLLDAVNIKVRADTTTLKRDVVILLEKLDLIDSSSSVVGVGMSHPQKDIMASSLYFVTKDLDPTKTVQDGKMTRIFASFHAGAAELNLLSEFRLISLQYKPAEPQRG